MNTINKNNKKTVQPSIAINTITKRANWNNRRRYSI